MSKSHTSQRQGGFVKHFIFDALFFLDNVCDLHKYSNINNNMIRFQSMAEEYVSMIKAILIINCTHVPLRLLWLRPHWRETARSPESRVTQVHALHWSVHLLKTC